MRVLLAVFAAWFAIVLIPDAPSPKPAASIEEKVWMSQTCDNSRWYLEDSDDQTVTLACYKQPPDSEDK